MPGVVEISVAVIGALGAIGAALAAHRRFGSSQRADESLGDEIETTFVRFDRGVTRYLEAAAALSTTFHRTSTNAFKSTLVHAEIDACGTELSAAYHELNEEAPRHLRALHVLLPKHKGLVEDADELLSSVLRKVHGDGSLLLNPIINAVNDLRTNPSSDEAIQEYLADVERASAIIRKETALAEDRQKHLRRRFREVLGKLAKPQPADA
jgi:hypothetical protein